MRKAVRDPLAARRELNDRSLFNFLKYFWSEVAGGQEFIPNWHVQYICEELEKVAYRVGNKQAKVNDVLINVPPGTTKTIICSIMFPAWCWTKWYWMRFITVSYSSVLSLESAEYSRDLVRSEKFKAVYPELKIKDDKDTKGNYKVVKLEAGANDYRMQKQLNGGNRFSTSVGGSLTGFHGDIIIWDDPMNPQTAASAKELENTNRWLDQTLPTRKTNKINSTIIGIMQRLHQDDPTGHTLEKKKTNLLHICLPGEIKNYASVLKPAKLAKYYKDDLLDVNRLNWDTLNELEADLGQYGFAGQIGQLPTPPSGGMFKPDHFQIVAHSFAPVNYLETIRYWDKAGTADGGAYTTGVKISKLTNGRWLVEGVKRGQWSSEERERIILETARADGRETKVMIEQEPGSGGKESAENTIRNLAGFVCEADLPRGNKVYRADPYSVQVNNGAVMLVSGDWNKEYIEEHRFFPMGKYKDQVDASAAAFNNMVGKKVAGRVI